MKYQNIKAFEKHLESAAPHNLCRCYFVAIGDDRERMKILEGLGKRFSFSATGLKRLLGSSLDVKELFEAWESPSLFGGETGVLLDECEKLKKEETEAVGKLIAQGGAILLLGARGKSPLAKLVEKHGVVLDLSEEKPWEKEKRIAETLFEQASLAGKRLAPDAAPLILERLGTDAALLEQEMEKLVCFVGERPTIERVDVLRISSTHASETLWQMAEEAIWEGVPLPDPTQFHALIPALRSQLQLGLKIATLIEAKVPSDQWSQYLPKIWPRTLEKRREQAAKRGSVFFQKGLDSLFKIELTSRTHSTHFHALLDLFVCSNYG